MKRSTTLVFDEQITSSGPGDYHTSQELNTKLGLYDQLAIHAVVDNPNSSDGVLTVQIEHSADGRNFLPKGLPLPTGKPAISSAVAGSSTSQAWGFDDGTMPSLAFVRLRIALTAPALPARVKVYVTSRDSGG